MVARSPPKDSCQVFDKMSAQQVRETVKKVDRAMARLQELQSTVRGFKVRSGLTSSPHNTRGDMHTSLRSGQESLRKRESTKRASVASNGGEGEWQRWSSSAALVQKAIGEILEASNFAKDIVNIVSDSMANKVMQDPKTPQSSFNGTNMLEESRRKDVSVYWNTGSVQRKNYRYNAQGFRKLNHHCYNLSNSEDWNIKAAQPTLETPPGKRQSLISHLQEEGLDDKWFLNGIGKSEQGNEEKKLTSNRSQKVVYKFRIITPENKVKALSPLATSSSLELRRKAEKQQLRAKARVELSQAGARVRSQMNFRASDCANDCGKSVKTLASALVSCCTSPARSIDEQKPLVKVDQITPVRKPWIAHHKPTKTIMFPNPTFVPSPSDVQSNSGKLCKNTRSLSYQKGFETPKYKQLSFLGKENVAVSGKMATRRLSHNISATKVAKQSSKVHVKTPLTMVKQSPVVKASAASAKNNTLSSVKKKTPPKFSKLFSPSKNTSPKHPSSSKKTVWFHRSNNDALRSDLRPVWPVSCNLSLLSKQLNDSPLKPLPSLISMLPSRGKRISTPMRNAQYDLEKEVVQHSLNQFFPNKIETCESVSAKILPLPPGWESTMPVVSIKDHFLKPSNANCFNFSANETPCQSSAHNRGRSISCPKQRPLNPVENDTNVGSTVNRISIVKASGAEFSGRRKDLEEKENKIDSEEEGHGSILKKSNGLLRRSWSFGHEKVSLLNNTKLNNNAGGGLPFLKYVRGFINMQKAASNIHK